jgi:hypothetical protein
MQVGTAPNYVGAPTGQPPTTYGLGWTRALSRGLGPVRGIGTLAKATPDGKWVFFNAQQLMMVKVPPFTQDDIDRSTFITRPVPVDPMSGAVFAVLEFGYVEFGSIDQHYCGTRREACVATSATIDPANPFRYEQTETYSGVPCKTGCSISIPLLPQHVAYYRVKYLDAAGKAIAIGASGVVTEK